VRLQCVAVCCSVLQCVAVWFEVDLMCSCSVLQCVAVCCSVLQYVAVCDGCHKARVEQVVVLLWVLVVCCTGCCSRHKARGIE